MASPVGMAPNAGILGLQSIG